MFVPFPYDKFCRSAFKTENFTDLIIKITLIAVGEVEKLLGITENDEGRGCYRAFRHIVNFKSSAFIRRGLYPCRGIGKNIIELTG